MVSQITTMLTSVEKTPSNLKTVDMIPIRIENKQIGVQEHPLSKWTIQEKVNATIYQSKETIADNFKYVKSLLVLQNFTTARKSGTMF